MNRRQFLATSIAAGVAVTTRAAEADRKPRVAVIGHTGNGDYGHGLDVVWLHMPEVELVAVADAHADGLEKARQKLKLGRGFADYRQMLAEVKPDIVAVAPRHVDEHRDMTMAAIEAGARGIYIEKPFCRTPAEADEIIASADKGKVKIAVAHRNRYQPSLPAIERMLKENAIGQVLEIRMRGKEDARGGAQDLWVLGAHLLNLATFFGGAPKACTATLFQDERPVTKADVKEGAEGIGPIAGNAVHARFEMERGTPVFFDSIVNAGAKGSGFGLQLIGTKGIIDLRFDTEPLAQLLPGNPFQPGKEPRAWIPISSAGPGQPEPMADIKVAVSSHLLAARDLLAAIHEDRAPLCSAADGRTVIEMIMAVFESHRLNGQRVAWPLTNRQNPLAQWT
ncbi:putative dehydrogenase [Chthoniobacter flavus]|nr:Gfo/Idh/MocA family oxidoreductase [Chthoniobacter flavus]TCO95421.1 putative dehydrogenase [Chthoniobacter flavus]